MSRNRTGVRPSMRTTSTVMPLTGWVLHQASSMATAFSMWPCFSQSGSKCGDLLGTLMYSEICGMISESHIPLTNFAVFVAIHYFLYSVVRERTRVRVMRSVVMKPQL